MDQSPSDPFSPSSDGTSEYSPDKYYVRSTNGKGIHSTVRSPIDGRPLNVPPEVVNEIAALIASQRIPEYRTTGDFLRDAFIHHLHRRKEDIETGNVAGPINIFLRLAESERDSSIGEAARQLVDNRERKLREERDPVIVRYLVQQCKADIPSISSQFYREEMERLVARYGG